MLYLSSDQHYWHSNVIKYCNRPFSSVEEMNEKLITNWNEMVKPDDTVIVVGDFSLALRPVETITPRLMGRKILVSGNHDWTHDSNKKSRTPEKQKQLIEKYIECGWSEVIMKMELDLPGIGIVNVSHLPYKGGGDSGYEERYQSHRLEDDGKILLCGHVHQVWKHKFTSQGTLMVNMGCDVWDYRPVSQEELVRYILSVLPNKP